jgi:integrase/recombinase XerD
VTHLRQIMLEELRRRNYAESTIHAYMHTVEHFSRHFHRSPDQLGPEQIRQYQAALFTRSKLAPNTVTQRLAALRFFYVQVLKRGWSVGETPYPKKVLHLPEMLSQEEVAHLIDAAEFPFHRILLMTPYATGARRAEVAHLKISDIDSQRMVIHIRGGKGRKDRDVMLSPKLLDALRVYWRGLKRKPTDWLFPATDGIRRVILSPPRFSGLPVSRPPNAPALNTSTVKALGRVFRGKFVAGLKTAFHAGALQCAIASWLRVLFRHDWVAYSKRPFGGPEHVPSDRRLRPGGCRLCSWLLRRVGRGWLGLLLRGGRLAAWGFLL